MLLNIRFQGKIVLVFKIRMGLLLFIILRLGCKNQLKIWTKDLLCLNKITKLMQVLLSTTLCGAIIGLMLCLKRVVQKCRSVFHIRSFETLKLLAKNGRYSKLFNNLLKWSKVRVWLVWKRFWRFFQKTILKNLKMGENTLNFNQDQNYNRLITISMQWK
jgi:hypothetical protein